MQSGRGLLITGWAIFVLSLFLPVNVSNGGLTDPGQPHVGFIHVFYSFLAWAVIFEGLPWNDASQAYDIIGHAVIGLFNLLMLLALTLLLLRGRWLLWAQRLMAFGALYVCTVGFVVMRHFELLLGFFVWCLSFLVAAVGLYYLRAHGDNGNTLR